MNRLNIFLAWLSKPGSIYFIFALYIFPRIAILFLPIEPVSDAAWYFARASELANGLGYSEAGTPTAFWPPGWPIMLSIVFKAFGASVLAAQIFNLGCAILIGWLTLDLGRNILQSEVAGRVALLLLAIYPNSIGFVPLVLTEVFYTSLLLTGCWLLVVCRGYSALLIGGLIFGVATLVKAQSLVVIPLIFGISVLRAQINVKNILVAAGKCATVIMLAALVVFPWSYRNYQVFGEWVAVSTNGGLTLLTGNNPSARGDYSPDDLLVTSIHRSVENQLDVDKEARNRAIEWIKANPGRFVGLMPLKLFRLWAPDGEAEWAFQAGYKNYANYGFWFRVTRYINQGYYVCLMLGFGWVGFLLLSRKVKISTNRFDWWLLPYAIALYPTMIALVFSGQSRFHYPVMPFVMMCCGWALLRYSERSGSAMKAQG